jgi:uncharacterized membrane protein SirB2
LLIPAREQAIVDYYAIKHFHMACAATSGSLFILRGVWMLRDSTHLQQRWVRITPHVVDTLLLASAAALAIWSGQYPFKETWLTAKFVALIFYIVLGTIALKRGKTKPIRVAAFFAAVLAFAYIGSVAITKQPLPFV